MATKTENKVVNALHAILDHFHVHPEDPIRADVDAIGEAPAPDDKPEDKPETEVKPDA